MIPFPSIDPVILSIGPLHVRWYGLMYILGFSASYLLAKKQITAFTFKNLQEHFEDLNLILILCVIVGGRLGYVLFYNFTYYLAHPSEIPATWNGGMSIHGAAICLIAGGLIFCRRKKIDFWKAADIYIVTMPVGIGLGRIGNFINGELFGRATTVPWGMVSPEEALFPATLLSSMKPFLKGSCFF